METKEIVKSAIQKSPEWLQDLIFSDALEETIISICASYNYPKEKIDDLTETVALLLIGANKEEDFLQSIKRVATNENEAEQIKKDIIEYILDPIKKDLLEEMPVEIPVARVITPQEPPSNHLKSTPETIEYAGLVNYKPGVSLKDTLLKKEDGFMPVPPQKERSSFERRLAGFNDQEEKTYPKDPLSDPYQEERM